MSGNTPATGVELPPAPAPGAAATPSGTFEIVDTGAIEKAGTSLLRSPKFWLVTGAVVVVLYLLYKKGLKINEEQFQKGRETERRVAKNSSSTPSAKPVVAVVPRSGWDSPRGADKLRAGFTRGPESSGG